MTTSTLYSEHYMPYCQISAQQKQLIVIFCVWLSGRQHNIRACAELVLVSLLLQACSQGQCVKTLSSCSNICYVSKNILFRLFIRFLCKFIHLEIYDWTNHVYIVCYTYILSFNINNSIHLVLPNIYNIQQYTIMMLHCVCLFPVLTV